jgi:hypothetical protein
MRMWLAVLILASSAGGVGLAVWLSLRSTPESQPEVIEVYPGGDIQAALDQAATLPAKAVVRVHAGVYQPAAPNEALIHFNARHDGIVLEGIGEVVLTAANPDLADRTSESFPAIVNHVVYFGEGISERTVLRNFRITGANGFVQAPPELMPIKTADDLKKSANFVSPISTIEPNRSVRKTHYFYTDGGAILIYGNSYPTIENMELVGNTSSVCAGGISIQHYPALSGGTVHIRNCIFRDNIAAVSGSAVDLLTPGGSALIEKCLFVGNLSDARIVMPQNNRYGALTVFPECQVTVRDCTFTGNSSGVDDRGDSVYENSIFWQNTRPGGVSQKPAFELKIANTHQVTGCFIGGPTPDLKGNVSRDRNRLDPPDPNFDAAFRPRNSAYVGVGYRSPE